MFPAGLSKLKLPQSVLAVKKIPLLLPFSQNHIMKIYWSPHTKKKSLELIYL